MVYIVWTSISPHVPTPLPLPRGPGSDVYKRQDFYIAGYPHLVTNGDATAYECSQSTLLGIKTVVGTVHTYIRTYERALGALIGGRITIGDRCV